MVEVHPTTRSWRLPPERAPLGAGLARTNLRELAARAGRFEHHLVAVARIGDVVLEHATASEPLYFAHQNLSDEYALALSTGDPRLDAARFRVFLSDPESGADVGRLQQRVGDLVLHPHGLAHWPGRLRPPFEMPALPGPRSALHSLVLCACKPTMPVDRPLFVTSGREEDAKAYVDPGPPLLLAQLDATPFGALARVGDAELSLTSAPFAPPRGGYVLVLEIEPGSDAFECDVVYVAPGSRWNGEGVRRALVFESATRDPDPPPRVWNEVPAPPFAPFEAADPGVLPFRHDALEVCEVDARDVDVRVGEASSRVPRYWLARMLFRLALHGFALGRVETYGGFAYDDRGSTVRLGLQGGEIEIDRASIAPLVEALYRSVAPPGYVEDLR